MFTVSINIFNWRNFVEYTELTALVETVYGGEEATA